MLLSMSIGSGRGCGFVAIGRGGKNGWFGRACAIGICWNWLLKLLGALSTSVKQMVSQWALLCPAGGEGHHGDLG